jgi:pimeloyl-ACP methyl ester carboxylesterase
MNAAGLRQNSPSDDECQAPAARVIMPGDIPCFTVDADWCRIEAQKPGEKKMASFIHAARFVHHVGMTVYTDRLLPEAAGARLSVVMIHGGGHSGACYLLTADNRPGWAYRFADAGYPVWLPDWPGCGRSGDVPFSDLTGERVCAALGAVIAEAADASPTGRTVLMTHSMSGALGWKLVEQNRPLIEKVVAVAPGPPGNIQPQANVIEETDDEVVVESFGMTRRLSRDRVYAGGMGFVTHKLIGKSTRFPDGVLDMYAGQVAGVPPRLLMERQNIGGSQLKVEDMSVFDGLPVLVFTGELDTDHPKDIDGAVVDWLTAAGAQADFWWLPDHGVNGNGHMLMMEENSDELADMIIGWVG